jgi:hypothetical protein
VSMESQKPKFQRSLPPSGAVTRETEVISGSMILGIWIPVTLACNSTLTEPEKILVHLFLAKTLILHM